MECEEKLICPVCGKEDFKSKMVSQLSLFNDLESWLHACCKAEQKKKEKSKKQKRKKPLTK